MADFVAVIRRAVDGLSDNNPDMRDKVYEKARGAVRRQLENMKPQPPEDMIQRQMSKLEAAITEVEGEYAEALPALEDDDLAAPVASDTAAEPYTPEPAVAEPVEQVEPEPVYETRGSEPEPVVYEPALERQDEVVEEEDVPSDHGYSDWPDTGDDSDDDAPIEEIEQPVHPVVDVPAEDPIAEPETLPDYHLQSSAADVPVSAHLGDTPETRDWEESEWNAPDVDGDLAAPASGDVPASSIHFDETKAFEDYGDLTVQAADDAQPLAVHSEQPSFDDTLPAQTRNADTVSSDTLDEVWAWPVDKSDANGNRKTGWDEFDEVLNAPRGDERSLTADTEPSATEMATRLGPIPLSPEPRRSRKGLIAGLIVLLLVGGVAGLGYAYWDRRDELNTMVTGLFAPSSDTPAATTPAATTPVETGSNLGSEDHNAPAGVTGKFNQRLQPDGTEIDPGPATGTVEVAEGKSVAAQNESGTVPPPAQGVAPAGEPAAGQPATPAEQIPATTQALPTGGQKMFLYEEKLGQAAPLALEGRVVWTLENEVPDEGGPAEPVIKAQASVPDRGVTALITIKRNTDSTLPASHIIEFGFSLPQNFEGGGVETVQRVAMKRTEQDRGDPLIGIPAKITEDFHMIALNDLPEAVRTNLDLLKNRSWIDIPVIYRNGRRALLTLEKGQSGTDAFNKAIQAWPAAPAAQ